MGVGMSKAEQLDVVCGMTVKASATAYQCNYQNTLYFFCSSHCLEKFKSNPQKYLQAKKIIDDSAEKADSRTEYTCPMHPEVVQSHAGNCPFCGMALEPRNVETIYEDAEYRDMQLRFFMGGSLTIPVVMAAMHPLFPAWSRLLQFILSTPVIWWAGWPFFKRAWHSLRQRHLNMFSLISLGVGAAYFYSVLAYFLPELFPFSFTHQGFLPLYFETAAMIIVLVLLGQILELKARSQTTLAIKALLSRHATSARIMLNGQEQEVPIAEVQKGDTLRVKPGDKVPVDGTIIEGTGLIDESMLTGEPLPLEKEMGSPVIGGTINQSGSFLMQAEKVGQETLLAHIVHLVAEAQRSRAPIQSLADQVASYFVPMVVAIAILTFIIWTWFGPPPSMTYGLVNAVAVLIIACPCALGLATPMSIMVGMGRGAEAGVLIKHAEALEKLAKVNTLIVDKTGTLTEGRPLLTQAIAIKSWQSDEILRLAAAVEQNSEHPLARAIVQEAKERNLYLPKVHDFLSTTGGGVSGQVEGHDVLVGQLYFLTDRKINGLSILQERAYALQAQAESPIFIAIDGQAAGLVTVSDPLKLSAAPAIAALHQLGLKIIMLSGDNQQTAEAIAKKLKIDEVHAGALPQYKQDFVKQAKRQTGLVAMAGDGINDAPALAAADVGIAMGTGTDVAMQSADVTLVKGDLMGIVKALHLSRATMRNIRQNLFFAFIYNLLGVPIAAGLLYPFTGILLNPMVAALAMSLSSVSVIVNALRLRTVKL